MTAIRKPERYFYPAWIILSALCIFLALSLYFPIIGVIKMVAGDYIYVHGVRHITEDYLLPFIFYPTLCLLTAVVQYGLLRRYLPRLGWWVPATAAGWLLGLAILSAGWFLTAIGFWTVQVDGGVWAIDPAFVVLAVSGSIGQWLLLRRRLPRAGWWIVANGVGWGLVLPITGNSVDNFDLFILGLLPACVTAVAFALVMRLGLRQDLP